MAIKVNGTTVIDDSRNLSNIAGGLKTVNSTSLLGSGNIEAGASTTAGAVGTYIYGRPQSTTDYSFGDTASGVMPVSEVNNINPYYYTSWLNAHVGAAQSGTWRCMSEAYGLGGYGRPALWVRIS